MYQIHPMTQKHLEQVAQIEKLSFSTPWSLETLSTSLTENSAHFYIASPTQDPNKVLAYGSYNAILDEGYINNIATHPDHKQKKIAGQLLDHILQETKLSLSFLSLEVRESNLPALALYQSRQFQTIATRKNYYEHPKENALILTKYF